MNLEKAEQRLSSFFQAMESFSLQKKKTYPRVPDQEVECKITCFPPNFSQDTNKFLQNL